MPRQSPFAITLTPEDEARLQRTARQYTSPYRDVIRAKIVLYAAQGLRNDEIAHRLDTPRQIVSSGASASSIRASAAWARCHGRDGRVSFPPGTVVTVKALACGLPRDLGLPLSRLSMADIKQEVIRRGLVASIGETTIWRWLSEHAIRPWHHRS